MSIFVECPNGIFLLLCVCECVCADDTGEVVMYVKGADDVIFDRMAASYDVAAFDETRLHINEYSSIGILSLLFSLLYVCMC